MHVAARVYEAARDEGQAQGWEQDVRRCIREALQAQAACDTGICFEELLIGMLRVVAAQRAVAAEQEARRRYEDGRRDGKAAARRERLGCLALIPGEG